jgi:L-threonylcarbamoyladenylate synthase
LPLIFDTSDPTELSAGISAASRAIREGKLIGLPTETVYGLAADATNAAAVAAIFSAKGRPRFNPLIVHVPSLEKANEIGEFDSVARRLADAFWPGPLTFVVRLRRPSAIADLAIAGLETVALRIPAHPVATAVLKDAGTPIAAPSANRSGHISPTTAAHVIADLGDKLAVLLDAGATSVGVESTIVGLAGDIPLLLRPGGVAASDIERVLGRALTRPPPDSKTIAPGMLQSHYAPRARLRLNVAELRRGEALLAFGPTVPPGAADAIAIRNLSPSANLVEAATKFFAALRELDELADAIAVVPIPEEGLGEAINDRLRRAAGPRG